MIQLRWVKRKVDYFNKQAPRYEKVLQYREMVNIEEIMIQPPIWAEWEDVPEEEE